MMTKKLVLYHKNCVDGWVAAVMAYQALGDTVDYIPVQYGYDLSDLSVYETVYILDYSVFPVPENAVMLDHHATAMAKVGYPNASYFSTPEPFVIIDIMKSGARLAQEYFGVGEHWIVDYAEDHDLWQFKLPNSREVRAGFSLLLRENIIQDAPVWLAAKINDVYANGKIIAAYEMTLVDTIAENALELVLNVNGIVHNCRMVNSATLISYVGERIYHKYQVPVACMWFQTGPCEVVVSLRGENVRVIAEAFGGGGHDAAAGFRLTDWEQIKQLMSGSLCTPQ